MAQCQAFQAVAEYFDRLQHRTLAHTANVHGSHLFITKFVRDLQRASVFMEQSIMDQGILATGDKKWVKEQTKSVPREAETVLHHIGFVLPHILSPSLGLVPAPPRAHLAALTAILNKIMKFIEVHYLDLCALFRELVDFDDKYSAEAV